MSDEGHVVWCKDLPTLSRPSEMQDDGLAPLIGLYCMQALTCTERGALGAGILLYVNILASYQQP
jgi:hypothetical protein